jgi:concanavalin A-like lectin/glucanase superfamily protein
MSLKNGLIASWELAVDGRDGSGHGRDAVPRGTVTFGPSSGPAMSGTVARFGAGRGHLEVPAIDRMGSDDFSIALWVNAAARPTAALGDLAAFFDRSERRGFTLGFQHGAVCGSHRNDRNLFFGIDSGSEPRWTDHGRPSESAVMIYALVIHDGHLYAATWEEGSSPDARGHVYRLEGQDWVDCGSPWNCNAVTRLAVHEGHLYAGVSRVKGGGSGRPESTNSKPGGRILRYEGGMEWTDCGGLEKADSVAGLVPFAGALYATPLYSQGVFRMSRPGTWDFVGTPGRRLLALGVFEGALYGAGNDHVDVESAIRQTAAGVVVPAESSHGGGGVFRYDGDRSWTSCGLQRDTTQVYSIETHGGQMHISTWPSGLVFRRDDAGGWENIGRLGGETEVMALASYNGMLYAGTLPHAEVYRLDRDGAWSSLKTLDTTPDAMYRRAHSMGVFRGELFCGTLPAARVHSMQAGLSVSFDRALEIGWHHVAAIRAGSGISLYVDGTLVAARSDGPAGAGLDLGNGSILRLGGGPQADLDGELAGVRLYGRALDASEVAELAATSGRTTVRPVPADS